MTVTYSGEEVIMPGMIMKKINRHPAYTAKDVISRVESYEYISFDVFDTLIKRAVCQPTDVFLIAARQVIKEHFQDIRAEELVEARIRAERKARACIGPDGEVTMELICQCFDRKYEDCLQEYLRAELDVERKVCHTNPVMKKVYDWCKENRKKIIIVSDMYLPKDFIMELLKSCGYEDFFSAFVSSDAGCRKATGQLYEMILRELNILPNQIIHIGDSVKADYLAAKRQSVPAVRIARNPIRTKYTKIYRMDKVHHTGWKQMRDIIGSYIDPVWDDNYQYGFEIIGPLLYGFCIWLHRKAKEHNINKMFFLARDGYLMQKAYTSIFGDTAIKNEYLYISRETARKAQIWVHSDLNDLVSSFAPGCYMKIEEFASYINIDRDAAINAWKACGMNAKDSFLPDEFLNDQRMMDFYERIRPLAVENSKDNYLKMIVYLDQNQFSGKVAIVDLGWRGTIQNCLQNLIDADSKLQVDMIGYYMGIDGRVNDTKKKLSFIPQDYAPNEFVAAFFEYPFLAPEGSLKGYIRTPDGRIHPEKHQFEYDGKELACVLQMQEGALHFIKCMKGQAVGETFADPVFSYANMRRVSKKPTLQETRKFGNLTFYEGEQRCLAVPKSILHYLLHVRDLPYDLSISGWRIGFLKRLLRIELNYEGLLKWYKNTRLSDTRKRRGEQCTYGP